MPEDALREALAAYAHEAWSGWMRYLFSKCDTHTPRNAVGMLLDVPVTTIPRWAVERWERQMNTPYADLPEEEKESDRAQADKILDIVFRVGLPGVTKR
jgi:hypothetical protein